LKLRIGQKKPPEVHRETSTGTICARQHRSGAHEQRASNGVNHTEKRSTEERGATEARQRKEAGEETHMKYILRIAVAVCMITNALGLYAEDWVPKRIVAITEYPPRAAKARIQGDVVIQCFLDSTGAVMRAEVVSGHTLFTGQARENASLWKFQRATSTQDGSDSVTLKYQYRLEPIPDGDGHTSFSVDLPNIIHIEVHTSSVDR
jgi:TonB family protein